MHINFFTDFNNLNSDLINSLKDNLNATFNSSFHKLNPTYNVSELKKGHFVLIKPDGLKQNIEHFVNSSLEKKSPTIALKLSDANNDFINYIIDKNQTILEKQKFTNSFSDGLVPAGLYFFTNLEEFKFFTNNEQDTSQINFGIPSLSYNYLSKDSKAALFLDRDGIINKDVSYLNKIDDFVLYEEVIPLIKEANNKNMYVFVVTNQSGIAREKFSTAQVEKLHLQMNKIISSKDVRIDDWIYCPYHYEAGIGKYKKHSLLRKPNSGMILRLSLDYNIDISRSFMLGDKESDALHLSLLKSGIIKRQYPITDPKINIFNSYQEVIKYIKKL